MPGPEFSNKIFTSKFLNASNSLRSLKSETTQDKSPNNFILSIYEKTPQEIIFLNRLYSHATDSRATICEDPTNQELWKKQLRILLNYLEKFCQNNECDDSLVKNLRHSTGLYIIKPRIECTYNADIEGPRFRAIKRWLEKICFALDDLSMPVLKKKYALNVNKLKPPECLGNLYGSSILGWLESIYVFLYDSHTLGKWLVDLRCKLMDELLVDPELSGENYALVLLKNTHNNPWVFVRDDFIQLIENFFYGRLPKINEAELNYFNSRFEGKFTTGTIINFLACHLKNFIEYYQENILLIKNIELINLIETAGYKIPVRRPLVVNDLKLIILATLVYHGFFNVTRSYCSETRQEEYTVPDDPRLTFIIIHSNPNPNSSERVTAHSDQELKWKYESLSCWQEDLKSKTFSPDDYVFQSGTLMYYALSNNDFIVLQLLLSKEAETIATYTKKTASKENSPILSWAIKYQKTECAQVLLEHGHKPEAFIEDNTPLGITLVDPKKFELAKQLVAAGADFNVKTKRDHHPLCLAISCIENDASRRNWVLEIMQSDKLLWDDEGELSENLLKEAASCKELVVIKELIGLTLKRKVSYSLVKKWWKIFMQLNGLEDAKKSLIEYMVVESRLREVGQILIELNNYIEFLHLSINYPEDTKGLLAENPEFLKEYQEIKGYHAPSVIAQDGLMENLRAYRPKISGANIHEKSSSDLENPSPGVNWAHIENKSLTDTEYEKLLYELVTETHPASLLFKIPNLGAIPFFSTRLMINNYLKNELKEMQLQNGNTFFIRSLCVIS